MIVLLRVFSVMFTISVAAGLISRPALSQPTPSVQVYPAPSNAPQSALFTVQVQGQPSAVYETQNPIGTQPFPAMRQPPFEATTAWTSFAADTPVTVQVTNKTAFFSARILPSSANIVPTLSGNNGNGYTIASFTLGGGGPQQVSVEFCYSASASQCTEQTQVLTDITNPLLVFANPLSANVPPQLPVPQVLTAPQGNNVPPLGKDQAMVYFGPGFYDLGPTPYVLGLNQLGQAQTAFLAGGAYVKGMFAVSDFTSIAGLGVLSGDVCPAGNGSACPMMIAAPGGAKTSGVTIRGITLVNAPYYNILLGGFGNTVANIKVISWWPNTDGISLGSGTLDGSFFKTGDDAIKLYSSNQTVSGCTMWQLGNAAVFEMGVNLSEDVKNVKVENCDVIRTEWTYPNRSNAVFSAAFGGNANGSGYTFNNIRIENTNPAGFQADVKPVFQLFKLAVIPNAWTATEPGNNSLGSISDVTFSNIQVTDSVTLSNLFQSFDREHQVSGITFDNVTVGGQTLAQPTPTFNANRNLSLSGTVFSNILLRNVAEPTLFLADVFTGAKGGAPPTPPTELNGPAFGHEAWAIGDVDGNGQASVLIQNIGPRDHRFSVWDQPMSASPLYGGIWTDYVFNTGAGIGDFNGDGRSDILLWNEGAGTILLMGVVPAIGTIPGVVGTIPVKPTRSDIWSVAGVGDIDQNGYSDVLLRDAKGNFQIWSFDGTSAPTPYYLPVRDFNSNGVAFDTSWQVAAVGDVRGLGYASIVWTNQATCQVGITTFAFPPPVAAPPKVVNNTVLGTMPAGSRIASTGDFNGDGTMDLLLLLPTGDQTIWYTGYFAGGAPYQPAPFTLPAQSGYKVQPSAPAQGLAACCPNSGSCSKS
jgi:hypothetical protein